MTVSIRTLLPPREILVCNLENHNEVQAALKEQDKLKEKWNLVIVDPKDVERAAKIFQEIVDEKRVTMVYMAKDIDYELYVQIRDLCTTNGIGFNVVDVEKK